MRVRIQWDNLEVFATFDDTPTTRALAAALPLDSETNTWGEEVYFTTPVHAALEPDAQQVVEPGTVGFWVEGRSLAIIFGRTPVSRTTECRYYTKVNILGRIEGDPAALHCVRDGAHVRVEQA